MKRITGNFRPRSEIIAEERTAWCWARIIAKDTGLYFGLDAVQAFEAAPGVFMVPGVCIGVSRREVDETIAVLQRLRERLPR